MSDKEKETDKQFHITLSAYDRKALQFFRYKLSDEISASAAIRACIRAAALQLGFNEPMPDKM